MSEKTGDSGKLKYIGIVLAIVIGGAALGFYIWYRSLPEIHERLFVFRTATGVEADVFINSIKVGKTPLTLSFEDLKSRFDPELEPESWPPEYNGKGESTGPGYSKQIYIKDARPEKGIDESIFYFDEKEAGAPDVKGALALRIQGPEGKTGVLNGNESKAQGGILKSGEGYVKGVRETDTFNITFKEN